MRAYNKEVSLVLSGPEKTRAPRKLSPEQTTLKKAEIIMDEGWTEWEEESSRKGFEVEEVGLNSRT